MMKQIIFLPLLYYVTELRYYSLPPFFYLAVGSRIQGKFINLMDEKLKEINVMIPLYTLFFFVSNRS